MNKSATLDVLMANMFGFESSLFYVSIDKIRNHGDVVKSNHYVAVQLTGSTIEDNKSDLLMANQDEYLYSTSFDFNHVAATTTTTRRNTRVSRVGARDRNI